VTLYQWVRTLRFGLLPTSPWHSYRTDCNICENVFIENLVTIPNRVAINNGVQIRNSINSEDDVDWA
jgi:hypothetical protein